MVHAVSASDQDNPTPEEAEAAAALCREQGAATISGAILRRAKDKIWFYREPAALLGRGGILPRGRMTVEGEALWDRRFIIKSALKGVSVGPLGAERTSLAPGAIDGASIEAIAAAPAIYCDGALITDLERPFNAINGVTIEPLTQERFCGEVIRLER